MKRTLSFLLALVVFVFASVNVSVTVYADNAANLEAHQITDKILQDYVDPDCHLDKYALTEAEEAELLAVAEEATSSCTTDYEIISAITQFVAKEIYYDYDYYKDRTTTLYYKPYDVWTNKRTVCEGYARLTKELLNLLNIPCICVYADDHAYNAAYDADNDRWIYLDSTWCSGNIYEYEEFDKGSYRSSYFDMTIEKLSTIDNHEVYGLTGIVVDEIEYELETPETADEWANLDAWKVCVEDVTDSFESTDVKIIGSFEGLDVTTINEYAFNGCSTITAVTIPEGIQHIKFSAFGNCTSLTSVNFPNSVTTIDDTIFSGCTSLVSIVIPDSVTQLGNSVFRGCVNLTSVTLPANITTLGACIFNGCTSLACVTIPENVTKIYMGAFQGCTSLTSVTIPNNVTSIGRDVFRECTSLTSVTIPDSVTSIGSAAFRDCTSLASFTIPKGMTTISDYTFYKCTSLTSVTIPENITSLKDCAFGGCTGFTEIVIPESVTDFGYGVFRDCVNLASVKLPDGLLSLGSYAFRGCTSLTYVELPDGLTSMGVGCFYKCTNLKAVDIPESLTTIDGYAFYQCYNLESVTIPDGVTSIGDYAFLQCADLDTVTIPEGVVSIGDEAFYSCVSLSSVTIPDSVLTIGDEVFCNCTALKTLTIPNGVTTIGEYVFRGCFALKSVIIYESVTSIGTGAITSPTVVYCYENSMAHNYAVANNLGYVLIQLNSTDNGVSVDSDNKIIFSSVDGCTDVAKLVSTSQGCTLSANASLLAGNTKYYGTGSEVAITINGVCVDEYIIVVNGDTNGDSVCDALDVSETELIANGHKKTDTLQCYAANGCVCEIIDMSSYQNVVNKALAS